MKRSGSQLSARRPGDRAPRQTGLIVCEGTKTEPRYLEALRRRLRLAGIKVQPMGKDPLKQIEEADALRKRRKQSGEEPYDRVWVVFDAERHGTHNIPALLQKAASLGIEVALSTPQLRNVAARPLRIQHGILRHQRGRKNEAQAPPASTGSCPRSSPEPCPRR